MSQNSKLIFVHNANSGYLAMVVDGLHKSLKPGTYKCNLCALTYGTVRMKKQWKDFIKNLDIPFEIRHKNDFAELYPTANFNLPAVFIDTQGILKEVITAKDFANFDGLNELIVAVKAIKS